MYSVWVLLCLVNRHGISQFGTGPVISCVVYDIKHSSHLFILIILIALACCGDDGVCYGFSVSLKTYVPIRTI